MAHGLSHNSTYPLRGWLTAATLLRRLGNDLRRERRQEDEMHPATWRRQCLAHASMYKYLGISRCMPRAAAPSPDCNTMNELNKHTRALQRPKDEASKATKSPAREIKHSRIPPGQSSRTPELAERLRLCFAMSARSVLAKRCELAEKYFICTEQAREDSRPQWVAR